VKIINEQDIAVPIDYYKISSEEGWLSVAGWNSMDDQEMDPIGEGWDESGGSNSRQLIEFVLDSAGATIAPNAVIDLGLAFNPFALPPGNDPDLHFEYGGPSGYLIEGTVLDFISDELPDYNLDGSVNAADYTVYRNCRAGLFGCTSLPPGTDPTPGIGDDDFIRWKNLYGTVFGGGGSVEGGHVPEPATLVAALLALAAASLRCPRRCAN
jgi:hypothetical protein